MQDVQTGTMVELIKRDGKLLRKDTGESPPSDAPIFKVGELVEIRGGWFRVHAIRPKKLIFKSVAKKLAQEEILRAARQEWLEPTQ